MTRMISAAKAHDPAMTAILHSSMVFSSSSIRSSTCVEIYFYVTTRIRNILPKLQYRGFINVVPRFIYSLTLPGQPNEYTINVQ